MKKYLTSVLLGFISAFILFAISFIASWLFLFIAIIFLMLGFAGRLNVNQNKINGEKHE